MRLIDGDMLKTEWMRECKGTCGDCDHYDIGLDLCMIIENAPIIDPVKHAKWKKTKNPNFPWECTNCKCGVNYAVDFINYCAMCGAMMEGFDETY